ncbi:MAG: riboflavin biosynthesis protein RibF [Firmicutes bacterium]|nr:riboflavin biosynthesis protein RibF [Bacillota bacterium]
MIICNQLSELVLNTKKSVIALGTFDGIHVGHKKIIRQAVEIAKEINALSVVFTFQQHPLSLIDPSRCPPQIDSSQRQAALIEELGVDILLRVPVTTEFLEMSPDDFVRLLCQDLNPACLVVGPNYSYGYKGGGTPKLLKRAGLANGFQVIVHSPVYVGDTLVSSTTIRQYIQSGKMELAAQLLGRYHLIAGPVVDGDKRGRTLGIPTANLNFEKGLVIPDDGVYAVWAEVNGKKYPAVANVGNNPTFQGVSHRIEVHIIHFSEVLYGQLLAIEFVTKLRGEIKFREVDELKTQMFHDVETAKQYLNEDKVYSS